MNYRIINILIVSIALAGQSAFAQSTLEVTVGKLENSKGQVIFMLYDSENSFGDREKVYKEVSVPAQKGEVTYTFDNLPYGTYALMVTHDEDGNGELDKNFVGFPKEPVGASHQEKFGRPSFSRSKFELSNRQKTLTVPVKLMN